MVSPLREDLRRSGGRMLQSLRLLALLGACLCAGAATVTLNGVPYTLRDHPRVMLDGSAGALTAAMSQKTATGRANPHNPTYKAIVAASEKTDPNLYQAPFGIALAAA